MKQQKCPHCGATPFVPKRQEGLPDRCDDCNALISVPEPVPDAGQSSEPKEDDSAEKGGERPAP